MYRESASGQMPDHFQQNDYNISELDASILMRGGSKKQELC